MKVKFTNISPAENKANMSLLNQPVLIGTTIKISTSMCVYVYVCVYVFIHIYICAYNNNNDHISRALFHVKHAQLR